MIEPEALQAALNRTLEHIATRGHALTGVFGDLPVNVFTYTTGLHGQGRAELWLGQMDPRQAGLILNALADRAELPEPPADVDVEWTVPFRLHGPVDVEAAQIGVTRQIYGFDAPVRVVQVLWPDDGGHYPGEDAYDAVRFPQVLLPLLAGAS